jgi:AraC-like DNA-binding protein
MKVSGLLDIINSIVVFQLAFFTVYLFLKGNKVPSVTFLKIYLLFQLIALATYLFWKYEHSFLKPLLLVSVPCMYMCGPAIYFYIRSRLYKNIILSGKLIIHAIPAILMFIAILFLQLLTDNFNVRIATLMHLGYYWVKIQFLIYSLWSLKIVYRYQKDIKSLTSSSEKKKLNWLFILTWGITVSSFVDFTSYCNPDLTDKGWDYVIFWIFINAFFFKAIINPDQYLGIDQKKLLPVKLNKGKSISNFRKIEEIINSNQLFLDPDLSLHNVALAVKLSDRAVSQTIKENTASNFTDYINIKRIEYAKEILRSTTKSEKNVLEILYESGFNSKSVFNEQFKKHTGQSPTDYRSMNRQFI